MACLNFQNTYFREHLLIVAFIRFESTCFSEHLKVAAAFFIKQPCHFFLGIYLKSHSKKHVPSLPLGEGIQSLLFVMFSWLLFTPTLLKNFSLLAKFKDFDFFKAYIRITKLLKINYSEKLIEELDYVELSAQAKHLKVWILHDDWLNDSPRFHFQFTTVWQNLR